MDQGINLKWVLVNNEIIKVSEIVRLFPNNRPNACCPVCNEKVTLKLGKRRIHHFAHIPPYFCALSNPETALHYSIIRHIYNELHLYLGGKLFISQRCNNQTCKSSNKLLFLENWDDVKIEEQYGKFIPDISVLKNNKVIGIIEVYVSHLMDDNKRIYFEQNNIPYLEINANSIKDEGSNRWTIQKEIPFKYIFPESEWICSNCTKLKEEQEKNEQAIRYAFEEPNFVEYKKGYGDHAIKMIDFYFSHGVISRQVYLIKGFYANWILVDLRAFDYNNNTFLITEDPNFEGYENRLDQSVNKVIKILEQRSCKSDIILQWQKRGPANFDPDNYIYPHKYKWNSNQEIWELRDEFAMATKF
jgi:competence CoiA-like predicted nuclease